MKNILFVLLLLQNVICYSQKIRFTDTANTWAYICVGDPSSPHPYITYVHSSNDTTMNGWTYYKMSDPLFYTPYWVREDTTTGKVYAFDTAEFVFMDYSLGAGDTLKFRNVFSVVQQVDSIFINNSWYKRQLFSQYDSLWGLSSPYDIIEGIGSTWGTLYPLYPHMPEVPCTLCWVSNNGNDIYKSYAACKSLNVKEAGKNTQLLIVPNPADKSSVLLFDKTMRDVKITIYNTIGQVIINRELHNADKFPVGATLPNSGVYYYRLMDNTENQVYSGSFIFE